MKNEEEIGPADSLSNKGSEGAIQDCLEDIKEMEREKSKDKEKAYSTKYYFYYFWINSSFFIIYRIIINL